MLPADPGRTSIVVIPPDIDRLKAKSWVLNPSKLLSQGEIAAFNEFMSSEPSIKGAARTPMCECKSMMPGVTHAPSKSTTSIACSHSPPRLFEYLAIRVDKAGLVPRYDFISLDEPILRMTPPLRRTSQPFRISSPSESPVQIVPFLSHVALVPGTKLQIRESATAIIHEEMIMMGARR